MARGMGQLAANPDVVVKLSDTVTLLHRPNQDHIGFVDAKTVALFGPDCCLLGSNFPSEKLWTDFGLFRAAHRTAVSSIGTAAAMGSWRAQRNDSSSLERRRSYGGRNQDPQRPRHQTRIRASLCWGASVRARDGGQTTISSFSAASNLSSWAQATVAMRSCKR